MTLTPTFSANPTGTVPEGYRLGDCPECGGIAIPLVGRAELAPHGQYIRRGRQVIESGMPCEGGGGPTAEDLEARPRKNRGSDNRRAHNRTSRRGGAT